jgi:hypothetical protein
MRQVKRQVAEVNTFISGNLVIVWDEGNITIVEAIPNPSKSMWFQHINEGMNATFPEVKLMKN